MIDSVYKLKIKLKTYGVIIHGIKYICEKYILHCEPIDDENNSLAFVKELLESNDYDNYIIASEILVKLKTNE